MKKLNLLVLSLILLLVQGALADNKTEPYSSQIAKDLQNKINYIDGSIKNNLWITRFTNSQNYKNLEKELIALGEQKAKLRSKEPDKIEELDKKIKTVSEQMALLKEYERSPFTNMLALPDMNSTMRVTNPFAIISGFSYIKQLNSDKQSYFDRIVSIDELITKLKEKESLLSRLVGELSSVEAEENLYKTRQEITELTSARDIAKTSYTVYEKRVAEEITAVNLGIKLQAKRTLNIGILILLITLTSLLFKYIAKKTITDNERFYTANKAINFISITLIILILIFAYIENVTYFVTVLGFASAGLAIAMKDMFMSMLGWMVIVFGGCMHVGDRIKVRKGNDNYVGDIIDISLLRITIYEDITLTTYRENRRSGRIIFIPNNYIFTDLIANYTHSGMKTVWDGIDILLTFDSNHKKAIHIIKNIARQYSKGYTDMAKKQMNRLRSQYSIKNPNVEPRIYSFFEPYGINISVWYMSNAYQALALRSTISYEIIEAIKLEADIKIAFPTQTLFRGEKRKIPEVCDISEEILY